MTTGPPGATRGTSSTRRFDDAGSEGVDVRGADVDALAELAAEYGLDVVRRCGRCGRPLTDPVSVARGIGPDCRRLVSA